MYDRLIIQLDANAKLHIIPFDCVPEVVILVAVEVHLIYWICLNLPREILDSTFHPFPLIRYCCWNECTALVKPEHTL